MVVMSTKSTHKCPSLPLLMKILVFFKIRFGDDLKFSCHSLNIKLNPFKEALNSTAETDT